MIGGQAVLEGIMMRNGSKVAVAVRDSSGRIKIRRFRLKFEESRIPFVRGIINLILMLYLGIKSLNYSASVVEGESKGSSNWEIAVSLVMAFVLAVVFFKFLPLFIVKKLDSVLGLGLFLFNLIDGLVKIGIFILYLYLISLMRDIYRVFQYHGAEHKAVNAYEAKDLKNVVKYSTVHKRCGTTFLFYFLVLSIFVYTLIPKDLGLFVNLGYRLLLLPVIASVSYEILKLEAKWPNPITGVLSLPGLWVQRITTKEPDEKQVEVAVRALKAVVSRTTHL